jgi:hypothetical protein
MNRAQRRAQKGKRLKMIQGDKPEDAPSVDMTQPAGRFAYHLHEFIVRYFVKNPDLAPTEACAAALQVAAKFGVEVGGDADGFVVAARHFFEGEEAARHQAPEPGPEVG